MVCSGCGKKNSIKRDEFLMYFKLPYGFGKGVAYKTVKKFLKVSSALLSALILIVVLVAVIYIAYFLASSYRLEDNLTLEVEKGTQMQQAQQGEIGSATPRTESIYTIASYNIGFGAYSDDYSFFMDGGIESVARSEQAVIDNVTGALDAIVQLNPDIVLLQEVDVDGTRSYHVDEKALTQELLPEFSSYVFAQNWDCPFIAYPFIQPHGANKAGIYTLTKFDIASALRRSLPLEDNLMSLIDLDRCYSASRIPVNDGYDLVIINLHLSAYTTDGTIAEEQLEMLMQDIMAEYQAGNWVIAGGDFNKDLLGNSAEVFGVGGEDYTWAQPIPDEAIPEGVTLIAPYDSAENVASCRNADHPYDKNSFRVTVDGFLVTDNVRVKESWVIDTGFKYSDHNPVAMSFELLS